MPARRRPSPTPALDALSGAEHARVLADLLTSHPDDRQRSDNVPVRPDAPVFTGPHGKILNPDVLTQTFERIVRSAGLPRIRLHDLRHTHASLLVQAGTPIKVVAERLGHANPGFTMQTYQHVLPGMQAEAVHRFAALLAPTLTSSTGDR